MRISGLAMPLIAALCAIPASAEVWEYGEAECNQLWFMRNLVMDRAGYCFGSPLGQALFDNGDCRGTSITLGQRETRQVNRIRELEAEIGCRVDTGRRSLDIDGLDAIRRLRDMPLPDNGGSACTWAGGSVTLYDGHSEGSAAIGRMERGDRVSFGYLGEGDWHAIHVWKGGHGVLGWLARDAADFEQSCTDWAG